MATTTTPTAKQFQYAANTFRGIGHPVRVQILVALDTDGVLSPAQLVDRVDPKVGLGNVAYHMRELRSLGLITPAGTEAVRGALQHFYRIAPLGYKMLGFVRTFPGLES